MDEVQAIIAPVLITMIPCFIYDFPFTSQTLLKRTRKKWKLVFLLTNACFWDLMILNTVVNVLCICTLYICVLCICMS